MHVGNSLVNPFMKENDYILLKVEINLQNTGCLISSYFCFKLSTFYSESQIPIHSCSEGQAEFRDGGKGEGSDIKLTNTLNTIPFYDINKVFNICLQLSLLCNKSQQWLGLNNVFTVRFLATDL